MYSLERVSAGMNQKSAPATYIAHTVPGATPSCHFITFGCLCLDTNMLEMHSIPGLLVNSEKVMLRAEGVFCPLSFFSSSRNSRSVLTAIAALQLSITPPCIMLEHHFLFIYSLPL